MGLLAALGALSIGCGSSDSSPAGSAGTPGGGASGGAAGAAGSAAGNAGSGATAGGAGAGSECGATGCIVPPVKPVGAPAGDGTGPTVLAIDHLSLGADPADAWKSLGYDLDGYISTKTSTYHCKVNEGGNKASVQTDGNKGIDNSFGENIMPIILSLEPNSETKVNESIGEGAFTVILGIDKLGSGKNYVDLNTALYAGGKLGSAPKFDGSDKWPVYCELLTTCLDAGTPAPPGNASKVLFPNSYVADGTWVSGGKGDVNLSISISGYTLSLNIHQAVLTTKLGTETPSPKSATGGVIAGVLDTEEMIQGLKKIAGNLSTSMCDGPTFENIAQQIRATSDIMKDGKQNPAEFCNGISVGLGYTMKAVQLGEALNASPPGKDPCAADGG
jgi:hypothetical protein